MKAGIITILKVNNYGAELQAYATQAALKKLDVDAEIIDYLFYKHPKHKKTRLSRPLFPMSMKKRLTEFLYPRIMKFRERKSKESQLRKQRFEQFHALNTSLSRTFTKLDDLYSHCPDYDLYIVGSDQVWNPGIYSSLKPYFLDFVPDTKRKMAYASSFGVDILPEECKSVYYKYLSKFDKIGVREKSGAEIVKNLGLKAENVLDPTLLLNGDDWNKVCSEYPGLPERYVAVYELTPSPYLREVAKSISEILLCPVVRICKSASSEDTEAINVMDAGPSEFLSILQNAQFVVTNSFHGTAFSVNFNKPFYTITPQRKNNNSRQVNLLSLLGLENRILKEGDLIPSDIALDFTNPNENLNGEREKSIKFLMEEINGK